MSEPAKALLSKLTWSCQKVFRSDIGDSVPTAWSIVKSDVFVAYVPDVVENLVLSTFIWFVGNADASSQLLPLTESAPDAEPVL